MPLPNPERSAEGAAGARIAGAAMQSNGSEEVALVHLPAAGSASAAPVQDSAPDAISSAVDPDLTPKAADSAAWADRIFDATAFDEPVDWEGLPVRRLHVIYPGHLGFRRGQAGYWDTLPPESEIRERIRRLPEAKMYCLDVEHWPVLTEDSAARTSAIDRLIRLLEIFREERPGVRLGYWGIFPQYTYVQARRYPEPSNPGMFAAQQQLNREAQRLVDAVDLIFPAIYAWDTGAGARPTHELWVSRARAMLDEAKEAGKPVIAFLWTAKGASTDFWRLQLEVALEEADAVAIWGHESWSPKSAWRLETLRLMREGLSLERSSFD
ncbi:hypothetical protein [Phycisphaera mikurensis]|nr:hypothetical protein [Phycisphaera mikurensis]MBB6441769.1 hypothetical protein [Phycisphaera mikurensis]